VLLADPPWEYQRERLSGSASDNYSTLSVEEISCLSDTNRRRVSKIVEKDAVLFLWATAPLLPEALSVIEAWKFDYRAQFVWDKGRGFNGHYNDVGHELLLIAVRGGFPPRCKQLRYSVVRAEKTRHSAKPEVFYEIIEEMYPVTDPVGHLELFARGTTRPGWVSWGDERVSQ
jgi:N6-adenosine-specific RNA methylase IME4